MPWASRHFQRNPQIWCDQSCAAGWFAESVTRSPDQSVTPTYAEARLTAYLHSLSQRIPLCQTSSPPKLTSQDVVGATRYESHGESQYEAHQERQGADPSLQRASTGSKASCERHVRLHKCYVLWAYAMCGNCRCDCPDRKRNARKGQSFRHRSDAR